MTFRLSVAIGVIAALPLIAYAQQDRPRPPAGPKPTAADVQKVVGIIRSDKAKLQLLCDLTKLDDQIAQAEQAKDAKKIAELDKKAEESAQKIGPEYMNLMVALEQIDHSSKEAQQLTAPFDALVKTCPK